jgi:hypothetical protein
MHNINSKFNTSKHNILLYFQFKKYIDKYLPSDLVNMIFNYLSLYDFYSDNQIIILHLYNNSGLGYNTLIQTNNILTKLNKSLLCKINNNIGLVDNSTYFNELYVEPLNNFYILGLNENYLFHENFIKSEKHNKIKSQCEKFIKIIHKLYKYSSGIVFIGKSDEIINDILFIFDNIKNITPAYKLYFIENIGNIKILHMKS